MRTSVDETTVTGLYATGAIERGIREGRRLRAAAMRHALGKVRDSLSRNF